MKVYKIGDLIIYGNNGVCRVEDITSIDHDEIDNENLYYVLMPLYNTCTIYAPTDSTKVFMRPIVTKKEAEKLIDMIPSMKAEIYHNSAMNQLTEHYKASFESHECEDLIELCMSIYAKKQDAEEQNKKLGAIDEKFMKRAEELLFGELATALGIDKEQVPDYIENRIGEIR